MKAGRVFADADPDAAAKRATGIVMDNGGRIRLAGTPHLVERSMRERFGERPSLHPAAATVGPASRIRRCGRSLCASRRSMRRTASRSAGAYLRGRGYLIEPRGTPSSYRRLLSRRRQQWVLDPGG